MRGMASHDLKIHLNVRDKRHAIENGFIDHLSHGLYGPASGGELRRQYLATLQALTLDTVDVVSHETAAVLHGALDQQLEPPFHVTSPRGNRRIRRPQVVGHRIDVPSEHIHKIHSVALTSPAWTWTDLALQRPLVDAVILADKFIRPGRSEFGEPAESLSTQSQLLGALKLRGRANGVRTASKALALARAGADSPQETRLRFYMHQAHLPEPEVNAWLVDQQGRRVVQPDLALREWRLAIQYDGEDYHCGDHMRKDVRRTERTEALGWVEVRITKDHMRNQGKEAIELITRKLRRQGWHQKRQ